MSIFLVRKFSHVDLSMNILHLRMYLVRILKNLIESLNKIL
jgi:hypothetical protein